MPKIDPHNTLAIIPARGGSKSVPRKNIALLNGKPLIYYTIAEAKNSRYVSKFVVSTDDEEIAGIASGFGAEVIMRPAEMATDEARTEPALIHVLEVLKDREGYRPDIVLTLEPTSPLRSAALIDRCVEMLAESDADAVITVVETSALVGRIAEDARFKYLIPNQPRRRQERELMYRESSTVYATKTEVILKTNSVLGKELRTVIADPIEAIDINEPIDLAIAAAVMNWREERKKYG